MNKLHTAMVGGHTDDIVYCKQMFNKYDFDGSGDIDVDELTQLLWEVRKELGLELNRDASRIACILTHKLRICV